MSNEPRSSDEGSAASDEQRPDASVITTRRATNNDLDECAAVLGEAFADYPWTRWTVDSEDHVGRITALQRIGLQRYGLRAGTVSVALLDDRIESVAVWIDSTAERDPPDDNVRRKVAALAGRRHAAALAADAVLEPLRPTERHLYLGTVGTRPAAQGRGLASRTLAPLLTTAEEDRLPVFLETSTSSNVAFYQRKGFEIVEHVRIDRGGPDVWLMQRPAG